MHASRSSNAEGHATIAGDSILLLDPSSPTGLLYTTELGRMPLQTCCRNALRTLCLTMDHIIPRASPKRRISPYAGCDVGKEYELEGRMTMSDDVRPPSQHLMLTKLRVLSKLVLPAVPEPL